MYPFTSILRCNLYIHILIDFSGYFYFVTGFSIMKRFEKKLHENGVKKIEFDHTPFATGTLPFLFFIEP